MRQTPWGPLRPNDAHIHFFSRSFLGTLAGQKGLSAEEAALHLGWTLPPESPATLASHWAAELDRCGIHRAALIASLPGEEPAVAEAITATPGRFVGYFMVNPTAEGAPRRLQAALDSGLHVPCFFPAMHGYSLADPQATALLEILDTATAPTAPTAFVHCGVLSVGIRKRLGLPSPFDLRLSNPLHLNAVALRFPRIRFIVPHFGAGFLREALLVASLCPNVFLDTSSSNNWRKAEGLSLFQIFRRALDVAGPERLLFGTDSSFFPRGWVAGVFEEQCEALSETGVSTQDARAIFGGNFDRLFAFP
ncbi:MAG: amidohydrolase [Acidobacteria bacterium]|nr:amidohydrolase [Acidobacteriota bacterium]